MIKKSYAVIIPAEMKPRPKAHEESAAAILSRHFSSDVHFLLTAGQGTPDISIRGVEWEMKSPIGDGRNTIQKTLRSASKQSQNVVIDLRRSKLHQLRALGYINQFVVRPSAIKRLIVVTKSGKILEIK